MRALGFLALTVMLAMLGWGSPAYAQAELNDPPPHLRMTLSAETQVPKAGGPVLLRLNVRPQPGWHGYWSNPGDAGFPTKFEWTLPKGLEAGPPRYPTPDTLLIAGLMNYVYKTPYQIIVQADLAAGLAAGTKLPVRLHLNYLVCTDNLCVPEAADLSIDLTVGDGTPDPGWAAGRGSTDYIGVLPTWPGKVQRVGGNVRIEITTWAITGSDFAANSALKDAYFFPYAHGVIDYAAPQRIIREGNRVYIETKASKDAFVEGTGGILRIAPGVGHDVELHGGTVDTPTAGWGGATDAAKPDSGWSAVLIAFLGAVLGGLILNVMPCVFPILSLKALSLARAGGDERGARHEALAYTAGAIAVCLALGGAILALRAGGSAVGWAFQLQNPQVLMVLLLLTVAIALNLAGVFELPTPQFVNKTGSWSGAFVTGALAAFVATPCTGPFMGAALGAALVLPWPAALAVFAGLGLGLALPFLLLGFVPALRKRLPKPGAWMDTLRRFLSIPMWLTAIALAWVLGRQAGVDGMGLALLVALGFAIVLWAAGRRQARGLGFGVVAIALLIAATAAGVWLIRAKPADSVAAAGSEAFSEAKLAQLRAAGRPVFAYFTADWCLTCKVNERIAIDPALPALKAKNVAVLVGDWTNGDAVLGKFIEGHNRAGVPLYLYYPAGGGEPQVLPQILTPSMLETLK